MAGFVQILGQNSQSATGVTTLSCTTTASATAGNTVIVAIKSSSGATITAFSDSIGNTYTKDFALSNAAAAQLTIYRTTQNVGTIVSGTTYSITMSATNNNQEIFVAEYNAIATLGTPIDVSITAKNTASVNTLAIGPTATTTNTNDIIVSILATSSSEATMTVGGSFNQRTIGASVQLLGLADFIAVSAATQSATWSWTSTAANTLGVIIAFRQTTSNTRTQPAVARIAVNTSSTQPAVARIALTPTKTQPAVSRIATIQTKTQSATANITTAGALTKTQAAIARIAVNKTLTQTATARIAIVPTKTQTAVSRIATAPTKTQGAIARIANVKTKTQTAISRISVTPTKTQPATGRIAVNRTATQTATANITGGTVPVTSPRIIMLTDGRFAVRLAPTLYLPL